MNAWKIVLALILASIFPIFLGCNQGVFQREFTLSDFDFLRRGMSLAEIINRVGIPDRDIGSGIFIIQYDLISECVVELVFLDSRAEKLVDARARCQDGRAIDLLVNPR